MSGKDDRCSLCISWEGTKNVGAIAEKMTFSGVMWPVGIGASCDTRSLRLQLGEDFMYSPLLLQWLWVVTTDCHGMAPGRLIYREQVKYYGGQWWWGLCILLMPCFCTPSFRRQQTNLS